MPRRNSRVGQRNARRDFINPDTPKFPRNNAVRLSEMVIPDGKCTLHRRQKSRYDTEAKAQQAMAQINRFRKNYPDSHKIKRVYQCPEETCGGWHLTSREAFDEEQARMIYERKNHINEENAS